MDKQTITQITFKNIREQALQKWLIGTKRQRNNEEDDYTKSFECSWQTQFGSQYDDHFSIFCSIGDWNTNLTDYLTDVRLDNHDLLAEENKDTLFRFYTKILLTVSEILTDFQDVLSTFRVGKLLSEGELNDEKKTSRQELDKKSNGGDTQRFFTFINNICKHKINNVHICNHHLYIHFSDSKKLSTSSNTIRLNNIDQFIPKKKDEIPQKKADMIEMPTLESIIETIIKGYHIIDETFKNDIPKFKNFCNLYKGSSVRVKK